MLRPSLTSVPSAEGYSDNQMLVITLEHFLCSNYEEICLLLLLNKHKEFVGKLTLCTARYLQSQLL